MREINIFTDGGRPCRPAYYYDPAKNVRFSIEINSQFIENSQILLESHCRRIWNKKINHNSFFTTTDMTNIVKLYDELPENITFEK